MTNPKHRLESNLSSFKFHFNEVQNVSWERHELLEKVVQTSKDSVKLKAKELHHLVVKEVKKINGFCTGVQKNTDVLISPTWTFTEDIRAFNLEYKEELRKKWIGWEFVQGDWNFTK